MTTALETIALTKVFGGLTAVDAVENDRVVRRYAAIVGDPEHHSPEVQAKILAVNINPTWTVPTSIIKNEIAPKMLKDPGYLTRSRIRVLNNKGEEVDPRSINWASERADYDYTHNSCAKGRICGHYTQVVWRTTTTVGCAIAVCEDTSEQVWVCHYQPPGNWIGKKPY